MRFLIQKFVKLILCDRYGMVCAELLKTVKTGGEGKANKSVLFFDPLYLLLLLFLLQIPS